MSQEKPPINNEDSASGTLRSTAPSTYDEKPPTVDYSIQQGSQSATPTPSVHENNLHRVATATAKETGETIEKINTRADGTEYPTGAALGLISLALCLSVFLMALDNSIIATAIPKITDHFHSLEDVGWYGSAYMLTTASFQLLFGKFYTYFSIKYVYLIAIALFELGSLICGVAPSSTALIMGRAIAGIGASGLFSGALVIVAYSVPLVKRPMYTGLIGGMFGIASVAGPLLGGVFTDKATWRWCFYINLPFGAITMGVIAIFFKAPQRTDMASLGWKARVKAFDVYGTLLFIPAIVSLLLALQWGGTKYPFNSWRIIMLFCFFGVLIIGFIIVQFIEQEQATIPPGLIKRRSMWSASFFSFCLGSMFMLIIFYLPIWFQGVKGASAVKSGIMNLPLILSQVLLSIIAGVGVTYLGYYAPLMIASSVIASIGIGLLTTLQPDSGHAKWIGYQALAGIGIGMGMQQPLIAVQTILDISEIPIGMSVLIFLQTLGGALFISIGQNTFTNKLVSGLKQYAPTIDPAIVLSTGATSIQQTIAKDVLPGVTLAYNDALTRAFLVATIMAAFTIVGSVCIEWKSVKGKKIEMGGAA